MKDIHIRMGKNTWFKSQLVEFEKLKERKNCQEQFKRCYSEEESLDLFKNLGKGTQEKFKDLLWKPTEEDRLFKLYIERAAEHAFDHLIRDIDKEDFPDRHLIKRIIISPKLKHFFMENKEKADIDEESRFLFGFPYAVSSALNGNDIVIIYKTKRGNYGE